MTTIVDGTLGVTFPAGGVGNPASAVVGLTDTQTLTNKTLTTPTISQLSSAAATALTLQSAGTTAVTIDTSQNVGIGTASPSGKLDVRAPNVVTDAIGQVSVYANDFGINYGGSIGLGGAYNTALTTFTDYTQIAGRKENSTSGDYAGYLSFATRVNGGGITERMRLNSTGALVLAGGSTSANGIGIAFPATQSASTDANTLDDYEEGSWTPTDGSGAGLSLTTNSATYTKIGNTVRVSFYGSYPATANTNQVSISGLPFTASNYGSANILSSGSSQSALVRMIQSQVKLDMKALFSDTSVTNNQLSSQFLIFTLVYIV